VFDFKYDGLGVAKGGTRVPMAISMLLGSAPAAILRLAPLQPLAAQT
jgi:hypothetical protein